VRIGEDDDLYRIDAVEQAEWQQVEAVRIERTAYVPGPDTEEATPPRRFVAAAPVLPLFLDLPLLSGDEVPHAPQLAVAAEPWPGPVAVFAAAGEGGFALNRVVERGAVVGITETPLVRAASGVWDRGAALRVQVAGGTLSSATVASVLAGANAAVIGTDGTDDWEVFQFAEAVLVAPDTYELTMRLRGQAGTDALVPEVWPVGSRFVLLDAAVGQIDLPASLRGVARRYRIGPASRAFDDPSYVEEERAFAGVGLRPYAPVHLKARRDADGALRMSWVRRTRIDGDLWDGTDVPLGEATEAYVVRVLQGGVILREAAVTGPEWTYGAAQQVQDGATTSFEVAVAQLSDRFGPGLFRRIGIDG
jgi:hypothetical protein